MSAPYEDPPQRVSISSAEFLMPAQRYLAALADVGRHPNTAILRALERGALRFHEVTAELSGVREAVVSAALQELGRAGLIARRVDSGPPLRVLYELTDSGAQLAPSVEGIALWAEREEESEQRGPEVRPPGAPR